jgi:hypothetical protein
MKFKLMIFVLCVAAVAFAQTVNQSKPDSTKSQTPAASQAEAKAGCPCCKAMAESKDAKPCCHQDSTAKDGKDAMSCMKDEKAKSGDAASGVCCKASDQKCCCAKPEKGSEQTAMACCGGSGGDHCGMQHHDSGEMSK